MEEKLWNSQWHLTWTTYNYPLDIDFLRSPQAHVRIWLEQNKPRVSTRVCIVMKVVSLTIET